MREYLETPFNENLVLSSTGCADPVLNPLLVCSSNALTPFSPGWRNEFHVGLQQAAEWDGRTITSKLDFGVCPTCLLPTGVGNVSLFFWQAA
jgi:hypothetical protein